MRRTVAVALLGAAVAASSVTACGTSVQTTAEPAGAAGAGLADVASPPVNTVVSAKPLLPRAEVEPVTTPKTAPQLRVAYNEVLDEHALLAMQATGASLGNRKDELAAASAQLQTNADELSALVTQIYDPKTGEAFSSFWRLHIGYFLEYTDALNRGDHATAARAGADLEKYAQDLENVLKSSNESMPVGVVRELVSKHVHNVDHQHASNWEAAYGDILPAIDNMRVISDHLTLGVQVKYGDRYQGDTTATSSKFGTDIATALQVHVGLVGISGGAATDGREKEAALGVNTMRENMQRLAVTLSGGGSADPAIESALIDLVGDIDAFAHGASAPTQASAEASKRLEGQAGVITAAVKAKYPKLRESILEELLRTYIAGLEQSLVAQANGDWTAAYRTMSMNQAHGTRVADVIADATV